MSKPKHTPGPWVVEATDSWIAVVAVNDDACVSITAEAGQGLGMPESMANAHLIAAAPELLEALELAYAYIGSIQGHADIHNATALYLKLQKTIAKARGES